MSAFELLRDLHKDARGCRPSASFMEAFEEKTPEAQRALCDPLCDELVAREAEEARQQLVAQRDYEYRLNGMVYEYGVCRATAIRWDAEAFDLDVAGAIKYHGTAIQEIEHFLYNQGLGFSVFPMYVAEITAALGLTAYATEA